MTVVFDTNIVVDVLAKRQQFYDASFTALSLCDGFLRKSCITSNTVTDIAYILHRYGKSKDEIKQSLAQLFSIVEILDVNSADCNNALVSPITDFEDAVLSSCATRHAVDFIVTRNPRDYKNSAVPCIIPADFVQQFGA